MSFGMAHFRLLSRNPTKKPSISSVYPGLFRTWNKIFVEANSVRFRLKFAIIKILEITKGPLDSSTLYLALYFYSRGICAKTDLPRPAAFLIALGRTTLALVITKAAIKARWVSSWEILNLIRFNKIFFVF